MILIILALLLIMMVELVMRLWGVSWSHLILGSRLDGSSSALSDHRISLQLPTPGYDEESDGVGGDYDGNDNDDLDVDEYFLDHNDDHSHDNETRLKRRVPRLEDSFFRLEDSNRKAPSRYAQIQHGQVSLVCSTKNTKILGQKRTQAKTCKRYGHL